MSSPVAPSGRGIALSLLASSLFAMLPGYVTLLAPLDSVAIFAWRIVCTLPGVLLILQLSGKMPLFVASCRRLLREPKLLLLVPLMAVLMGVQLWLFLWAPFHGQVVAVSLGYFLAPLVMVLVGRLLYGEKLYRLQAIAVALALLGVGHEIWLTQGLAWPTLLVVLGYPPYFVLRRLTGLDAVCGFALEMLLLLPAALCMLWWQDPAAWSVLQQGKYWLLLPGLGLVSSVALLCNIAASHLLPMGLWGLLGYVEPALLFLLAISVLGEPVTAGALLTYGPIWGAILLTGVHTLRQQRKLRLG
ncbi:EamA family transporter RarD [Vogesella oryzae]|uniref:EamA family transporter RarD n=1 Tax=Vogesella oryzae TaxID=1735285 RepID=UPI0015832087|nr:EamA family transporter RarD [Vogesella oryzae]